MKLDGLLSEYRLLFKSKIIRVIYIAVIFMAALSAYSTNPNLPLFMRSRVMSPYLITYSLSSLMFIYLIIISRLYITNTTYKKHGLHTISTTADCKLYYIKKMIVMEIGMFTFLLLFIIVYCLFSLYTKESLIDFKYNGYLPKYIIFFLVSSIHYTVYVSIATMFSFHEEIYGIILPIVYMFFEGRVRVGSTNEDASWLQGISRQLPGNFLLLSEDYISADRIISPDYILSIIPAFILIILFTSIGITMLKNKYKNQIKIHS